MSQHYRVRWEIDLEAASALAAAWLASELQQDPRSVATVFEVVDEAGRSATFDLPRHRRPSQPIDWGAPARVWGGPIEDSARIEGN